MSRCAGLIALATFTAALLSAQGGDLALWREFGLVQKTESKIGNAAATAYRMKDVTGAVAVWEWQRPSDSRPCALEPFCSESENVFTVASANYVVAVRGRVTKPALDAFLTALPNRRDTSLPAILTYVPRKNLVPNSARYVLGRESLKAFTPELATENVGFEQGAEAEVALYRTASNKSVKLAVFYYPTPEMARLHAAQFRRVSGLHVKRSSVLVALVFGGAAEQEANALLGQIGYEAKITWNDVPPPSPIKPMYQLLRNIIFLSLVLVALCTLAGLIYAGIRIYRRRFGTLEEDEAMTTLHLSGD